MLDAREGTEQLGREEIIRAGVTFVVHLLVIIAVIAAIVALVMAA